MTAGGNLERRRPTSSSTKASAARTSGRRHAASVELKAGPWHLAPSLNEPDTLLQPAWTMRRSYAQSRRTERGGDVRVASMAPGRMAARSRSMCLHTIISTSMRRDASISSAGTLEPMTVARRGKQITRGRGRSTFRSDGRGGPLRPSHLHAPERRECCSCRSTGT